MGVFFWFSPQPASSTLRTGKPLCLCPAQCLFVQETKLGSAFSLETRAEGVRSTGFGTGIAVVVKSNCNKTGGVMRGPLLLFCCVGQFQF